MVYFVSIFRTNISTERDKATVIQQVKSLHNSLKVHVDLEDEDRIMRVMATENISLAVLRLMTQTSYSCVELDCFYNGNSIYTA